MSWEFLLPETVLAIHDRQLAEHGGAPGVRDMGLLISALNRAKNKAAYAGPDALGTAPDAPDAPDNPDTPDVFDLAAAYIHGIVQDHPFVDGNKRTAYVTGRLFLRLNDAPVTIPPVSAVLTMVALASGELGEEGLAERLRGWQ